MNAYAVLSDRSDFRIAVLICDVLRSCYREFNIVEIGLPIKAALEVCKEGEENRVQADLRLRERRLSRARSGRFELPR